MEIQQNGGSSASEACQTLKSLVANCFEELAGGKSTPEWRDETKKLAASTISLSNSKTNDLLGKPWDIEIRTALSYFHRYKDRAFGSLELESDLGIVRTFASPQDFARLLLLSLEEATRSIGLTLDIRCNDAGILCVTTESRLLLLRNSGRLPCPNCCQWLKGEKGLWWHFQEQHKQNHSDAMSTVASTITTNAIIPYGANVPGDCAFQSHIQSIPQQPTPTLSDPVEIAQSGNVLAMQELIRQGLDPSTYIDNKGASLLLWAAGAGQLDMAKLLIVRGCSPDFCQRGKRGFQGRTALHWAARNGHLDMVVYLTQEHKVCLDAKTVDGTTAFCWAAWQGHEHIMKYLHAQGCDVSSVNSFGCNAALWAAQGSGSAQIIAWLDAIGCSCLVLNDNNHGILHKAAQRGKHDVCDWFLRIKLTSPGANRLGIDMICPDSDGCLSSDLAGMEGHEALAQYLATQEQTIVEESSRLRPVIMPSWLCDASPMIADSIWEPWAGVKRLRYATRHIFEPL